MQKLFFAVVGAFVACVGLGLVAELPALAQVRAAPRLELSAAPGCPSIDAFKDQVGLLTGVAGDPFDSSAKDVIRVTITKTKRGFHGRFEYFPAEGDPWPADEEDAPTCEHLFLWAPLLASFQVPDAPSPTAPKAAPPSATTPPPASSEPTGPPPTKAAPSVLQVATDPTSAAPIPSLALPKKPMDVSVVVSAGALLTAGLTDTVGPAVQLGAEVRGEMFSLGLEFRTTFPQPVVARVAVDPKLPTHSQAFDFTMVGASLVPCVRFATYFAGCGVVAGLLQFNKDYYNTNLDPNLGLGLRFVGELPLGERFALFGLVEGLGIPRLIDQLYPDPSQNVIWSQSPISGFFGIGVSAKFK